MRTCAAAIILMHCGIVLSQETSATQIPAGRNRASNAGLEARLAHMLKAADHLAAAGLFDQANRLRESVEVARATDIKALLARKEAELKTLRHAVLRLRDEVGTPPRQIGVSCKIIEASHKALHAAGFEIGEGGVGELFLRGKLRADGQAIAALDAGDEFLATVEALCQKRQLELLAEPNVVTVSGRKASLHIGGEFPRRVYAGNGNLAVEFMKHGIQLDVEPRLLPDGRIRLQLDPRICQIDESRNVTVNKITVPGLRVREFGAQCECKPGQTIAIAESLQTIQRATGRKWLMKGGMETDTVELLMLATPDFIGPARPALDAGRLADLLQAEAEMQDLYDEVEQLRAAIGMAPQQIVLVVQIMEFSLSKIRASGVAVPKGGFADLLNDKSAVRADMVADSLETGDKVLATIESLRKNSLVKVLAAPKLVTVNGRPVFFNAGGEFPVATADQRGEISIEYKKFGTQLDMVPRLLADGTIRLELHPRVSERDDKWSLISNGNTVSALKVCEVEAVVEARPGQTVALAGGGIVDQTQKKMKDDAQFLILATPELKVPDPPEVAQDPRGVYRDAR